MQENIKYNQGGTAKRRDPTKVENGFEGFKIFIQNKERIFEVLTCDDAQITWERRGVAGKLTFDVLKDDILDFTEGNIVTVKIGDQDIFLGYVFTKSHNKSNIIKVTAYDQLRYLKNKDIKNYINKRADQVIQELAEDYQIKLGSLEDTKYVIPKRRHDNKTLFDMMLDAIDLTFDNTNERYTLYDDFGKLTLKNVKNMHVNTLITIDTAEDYSYVTSIDQDVYNRVKFWYDNKSTGQRDVYIVQDSQSIADWGILQLADSLNEQEARNAPLLVETILKAYNQVDRSLTIKNAFGDIKVRGGSYIPVILNLGDIDLKNYMLVERVTHKFSNNSHFMDLELKGGFIDNGITTSTPRNDENNNISNTTV